MAIRPSLGTIPNCARNPNIHKDSILQLRLSPLRKFSYNFASFLLEKYEDKDTSIIYVEVM